MTPEEQIQAFNEVISKTIITIGRKERELKNKELK
jgi:hypothetical protein